MKRLSLLAAVVLAALVFSGGTAVATKGNCDPGAGNFNEQTLAKGNGAVVVDARYGWDGSSVFPDCNGPLLGAHVTNVTSGATAQTWYAVFPRPRRPKAPPIVITIGPGFDQTYTPAQLSAVGLDTIQDLQDFDLTPTQPG